MVRTAAERARRQARRGRERLTRRRFACRGTVQGVGFRPAVHRLARELGLAGLVRNDSDGATVEVEGPEQAVRAFAARLRSELPPLARLASVEERDLAPLHEREFRVLGSSAGPRRRALVPPDAKLCGACRAELDDPRDRRHAYPFTTCTHCGPRFTLVEALPYDRERTSMARFPLCARCAAEYADPADRRFHAEPACCPDCGPRVALETPRGEPLAHGTSALTLARAALAAGRLLALQGLGGFQLACRADDSDAVRRLRAAKHRPSRPFAVLARDLATARALVHLRPEDERLLDSAPAPILLAPRRSSALACAEVAPGVEDLGVFLPTTPLHVELFRGAPYAALVATSGNLHDEPICRTAEEARSKLGALVDLLLVHDREIVRRADDSVVRALDDGHVVVRRSRGYVPAPLALAPAAREPVLALGGHLQVAAALALGDELFPSQHVGDLDTEAARAFLGEVALGLEAFLEVEARVIAVDLHPDYPSTWLGERLASERGARLVRVQHHLAHAAAVLGEHGAWPGADERVAAIVLDGTGFGPDDGGGGAAWGAEWLELDGALRWRRAGSSEPLPLIGGERAVREPWRVAAAALELAGLGGELARLPLAERVAPEQLARIGALARRPGFPRAHGAGRLFEAAGALAGACAVNTYEGEAAARFEALAADAGPGEVWSEPGLDAERARLPSIALLAALARRLLAGERPARAAADFHATFCALAAELARRVFEPSVACVALAGGCLVNRRLARGLVEALAREGRRVLSSRELPPGDGGLAAGQAVIASAALAHGQLPRRHGADPCA